MKIEVYNVHELKGKIKASFRRVKAPSIVIGDKKNKC